jgi:predicted aspartyl protease
MPPRTDANTGGFSVEFEVANYRDLVAARLGLLEPDKVRRMRIRGTVDTGVMDVILPGKVTKQLGLPQRDKIKVRFANGRGVIRELADDAYIEILRRNGTFKAIVEQESENALLGAIVLEALDLLPDCKRRRLVPRDPNFIHAEIE